MTPPARKPAGDDDPLLVATRTFSTDLNGVPTAVNADVTRVRASHPLARKFPDAFREAGDATPTYQTTTRAPGEKRGEASG